MKSFGLSSIIKAAKDKATENLTERHRTRLFGVPPSSDSSGKLTGGVPPDMNLITLLYSSRQ